MPIICSSFCLCGFACIYKDLTIVFCTKMEKMLINHQNEGN
ncbi:hypothetical protein CLOBOL_03326 [Enterocloster bolteae ATCC BAA-613]|uniref:Uncharacterized protein n=1 Tax=Enterocloster bolteae (strain ATCC BAA-613 / DSM 15670 / CCUG 46953 / JCM 12243 / WAL 16351) TaxID=411902 RepID=A8RSH6_ENTBW|nr:hypothetical protein CLOBOL_03326 [Enterocloster bolteae ATCC BAA-613]